MGNLEVDLGQQIQQHGSLLSLLSNKVAPVNEAFNQLNPFNERKYIEAIGNFVIANPLVFSNHQANLPTTTEEVIEEYKESRSPFSLLLPLLEDLQKRGTFSPRIEYSPFHWNAPETKLWSIGDALEAVYGLGCPPLFLFHKTAHVAIPRANHSTRETILANPLVQKETYLTEWVKWPLAYLNEPGEQYQYMIAFPMKEIFDAQWRMKRIDKDYSYPIGSVGCLQGGSIKMDFTSVTDREMKGILAKTQVFLPKLVDQISK